MIFRRLADLVLLAHFAFVVFVALGGLVALRWPKVAWAHLPAAAWGAAVEFTGWRCPLTLLENALRIRGGGLAYAGDCIDHYVAAVIYPHDLTRAIQFALGAAVLILNTAIYWRLVTGQRRAAREAWPDGRRVQPEEG